MPHTVSHSKGLEQMRQREIAGVTPAMAAFGIKPMAPWNDPKLKWVCEDHNKRVQGHRLFPFFWLRCGGAGMPSPDQRYGETFREIPYPPRIPHA